MVFHFQVPNADRRSVEDTDSRKAWVYDVKRRPFADDRRFLRIEQSATRVPPRQKDNVHVVSIDQIGGVSQRAR